MIHTLNRFYLLSGVFFILVLGVSCARNDSKDEKKETLISEETLPSPESLGESPEELLPSAPVSPSPTPEVDWGKALRLRVVHGTDESDAQGMPDLNYDLQHASDLSDRTVQGMEIQMHSKFHLKDSKSAQPEKHKNLYFVWPEEIGDSRVSSAQFSIRVQTADGKKLGLLKPKAAWHDSERHRWFIPMSELYKDIHEYSNENVSLLDTQVLDLDLSLEKGASLTYSIRFQISGPLPVISVTSVSSVAPTKVKELTDAIVDTGWIIQKEQIVNPTSRALTLWVKVNLGSQLLSMETFVTHPKYISMQSLPPIGPLPQNWKSRGSLTISRLEAKHQDGTSEAVSVQQNSWMSLELKPSETLTLNWMVTPTVLASRCSLPASVMQTYTWTVAQPQTYHWDIFPHLNEEGWNLYVNSLPPIPKMALSQVKRNKIPDPPKPPVTHTVQREITWSLLGAQIHGNWIREIRIANPYTSKEEVLDSQGDSISLGSTSHPAALSVGVIPSQSDSHNCQGFFNP